MNSREYPTDDEVDAWKESMGIVAPTPARSTCCDGAGCLNCNESGLLEEQPEATVVHWEANDAPHDGPGWYYYDQEYQDEGSVGAFATREEAEAHARDAGYRFDPPQVSGSAVQP